MCIRDRSLIVPLSFICALWTWAIDAAATGSDKFIIELKLSSPKSFLIISLALVNSKWGKRSCKLSSCFDYFSPIISGLVARNWPNLINVVPIDCKEFDNLSPSVSFTKELSFFENDKDNK